jgi:hypothetical protein
VLPQATVVDKKSVKKSVPDQIKIQKAGGFQRFLNLKSVLNCPF